MKRTNDFLTWWLCLALLSFCVPMNARYSAPAESSGMATSGKFEHKDPLPRNKDAARKMDTVIARYLEAVRSAGHDLHSVMVVQHGEVIAERWLGDHAPDQLHILNSVSKTFTSMAVGFAVAEGRIRTTDKVVDFFADKLPANVDEKLKKMEIRHLLTMSSGHDTDPTANIRQHHDKDWVAEFLAAPLAHEPGQVFVYNSLATYMLAAIVQKVTNQKTVDYLRPRLFDPLGIGTVRWDESPQGINCGGWGLYVRTEDMAKLGQLLLQKGEWKGRRLLPAAWIDEASTSHIASIPAGARRETLKTKPEDSDWLQGYGYQMWRCRHNAFRADGANGQFIVILPEKDAVIVTTAHIADMQAELNMIWEHWLPAL